MSLFGFFDFKNGGLCHITINFDSLFRRLLASTTETNYTAFCSRSQRSQPYQNFYHPWNTDLVAPHVSAATFFYYSFLTTTFYLLPLSLAGFQQLGPCHIRGQWQQKFLSRSARHNEHFQCAAQGQQTHNQPQKKQEAYNQARARAVTYHRSQSRLSDAALESFCCCCCSKGTITLLKNTARKQALSYLALSHSRFLSALTQPPPHPAAKEFCICIHTLDCCAALRPPPFAGAALFISKGYCIAKGGRRAQDAYLIDASCEVAFLHMLGRTLPMLESPAAPIWLAV